MRKAFPQVAFGVFAAIVLAMPASVGVAEAQIPSNNVFYACIRLDRDGDEGKLVRLVAESERCDRREQRVKWNVQGPEGPRGPQGPQGCWTGRARSTGCKAKVRRRRSGRSRGSAGAKGRRESSGPQGPQGFSVTVAPDDGKGCGALGGVKLTLLDSLAQPLEGADPQFVCNGAAGAAGPAGPQGPQGTWKALKARRDHPRTSGRAGRSRSRGPGRSVGRVQAGQPAVRSSRRRGRVGRFHHVHRPVGGTRAGDGQRTLHACGADGDGVRAWRPDHAGQPRVGQRVPEPVVGVDGDGGAAGVSQRRTEPHVHVCRRRERIRYS